MDFDVDPTQRLGADVDLDEAGVDCLVELSEAGYKTDGTYTGREADKRQYRVTKLDSEVDHVQTGKTDRTIKTKVL